MEVFDLLQRLGFTEYEARVYVTLLQQHPANGARIAKASGVPRPNVYNVLEKLEERGAALHVETAEGIEYLPVQPDELIDRLSSQFSGVAGSARKALGALSSAVDHDYVRNIRGERLLFQHASEMIDLASSELLVGVWLPEAQKLAAFTNQAVSRGVALTTLCWQACPQECGNCRGSIHRHHLSPGNGTRGMVLVRDASEMLVGSISGDEITGIRTKQHRLVEMTSWYIRHSIAVALLLTDFGSQLSEAVSPATRDGLQAVGPGSGWLESLLLLLNNE
jgi:HTH-type transcriptional regulator, sugar sensing transcriptional regulator